MQDRFSELRARLRQSRFSTYLCLFFGILYSSLVLAQNLDLDLRYHATAYRTNTVDETLHANGAAFDSFRWDAAVRLAESSTDVTDFNYEAGLSWEPFSFLNLSARLTQELQLYDTTSETDVLALLTLHTPITPWLAVWGSYGWYERATQVTQVLVLPTPWRWSNHEHDFSAELGIRIQPDKEWAGSLRIATFETIDVFNLNNPFAEALIANAITPDITLRCYTRYQVLLGFGRLDEWLFGLGLTVTL